MSHESDKPSRSAEELFDGGKIKPLEPEGNELFTTHHVAEEGNKVLKAFSPKTKKNQPQGMFDNILLLFYYDKCSEFEF